MFTIPKNTVYTTDLGSISMIPPSYVSGHFYEIYCLEGDLFDDIERFATLEAAEERINNLLKL
jgi:hypothetical protein